MNICKLLCVLGLLLQPISTTALAVGSCDCASADGSCSGCCGSEATPLKSSEVVRGSGCCCCQQVSTTQSSSTCCEFQSAGNNACCCQDSTSNPVSKSGSACCSATVTECVTSTCSCECCQAPIHPSATPHATDQITRTTALSLTVPPVDFLHAKEIRLALQPSSKWLPLPSRNMQQQLCVWLN